MDDGWRGVTWDVRGIAERLSRRRGGPELLIAFPLLYVLHVLGYAVPGNFWVFAAVVFGGSLALGRVGAWRLARPASRTAWWVETVVQVVHVVVVLCLTGWAPLLTVGFLLFVANRLTEFTDAWRRILVLVLAAAGVIQLGLAVGVVHTYLPPATAAVTGVLTAMCVGLGIRSLGTTAAARAAAERALAAGEERFRTMIEASSDVITVTDTGGRIQFVSASVQHVTGWTEAQYRELPAHRRVHPDDMHLVSEQSAAIAAGAAEHRIEVRMGHADGTWHWHAVLARNLIDHPAVRGVVYNHRDITARKMREEYLAYEVSHDALTGLANRTALRDRLAEWCSGRQPTAGAVLFIDLDGFKRVNDDLGHAAGDQLLVRTARALQDSITAADTAARLGGDEFAVLLTGPRTEAQATAVADRIIERLRSHGGVRASVGVALCHPGRVDAREILHRADLAMYQAKRLGTHGWVVYDENAGDYAGAVSASPRR